MLISSCDYLEWERIDGMSYSSCWGTYNTHQAQVTKGNSSGFSKLAQFKLAKIATPTLLVSEPETPEEEQVETQITEQEELTQLAFAEEGVE